VRSVKITVAIGERTVEINEGFLSLGPGDPVADGHVDEPRLIAAWLWRNRARVRIVACEGELAMPIPGGSLLAAWAERLRILRAVD